MPVRTLIIAALLLALAGCGGSGGPTPPAGLSYAAPSLACTRGVAIAPDTPASTGGAITAYAMAPDPPSGLVLDPVTGILSGTPTTATAAATYHVTGSNAAGSAGADLVISVAEPPPAPVLQVQPHAQIAPIGSPAVFQASATGTGALAFQWLKNGVPVAGATQAAWTTPPVTAADDGAPIQVRVADAFGNQVTSAPAPLIVRRDLSVWLGDHPAIAAALTWQVQPADPSNVYVPPGDAQKQAWAAWDGARKADLDQAYQDACAWYSAGERQADPGDQPVNQYPALANDAISTMEWLDPATFWRLYRDHAAFSLMLEAHALLPWSVTDYPAPALRYLYDSATMGWLLGNGSVSLGTYGGAWLPTLRADNRPRTSFAQPAWTHPWLRQAGITGPTRRATIGALLDWMRQNLAHFYGADSFGTAAAVWQYRGYPPLSRMVAGSIDSRYPDQGLQHWTAGCHGSAGFIHATLRVLNIPVQPVWVAGHELVYFMSEDAYLDHADDPYNQLVKASATPSLALLLDAGAYAALFSADPTVNILDAGSPAAANVGYVTTHLP